MPIIKENNDGTFQWIPDEVTRVDEAAAAYPSASSARTSKLPPPSPSLGAPYRVITDVPPQGFGYRREPPKRLASDQPFKVPPGLIDVGYDPLATRWPSQSVYSPFAQTVWREKRMPEWSGSNWGANTQKYWMGQAGEKIKEEVLPLFSSAARKELEDVDVYVINPRVEGGGGFSLGGAVLLRNPQEEAAIHELAHEYWRPREQYQPARQRLANDLVRYAEAADAGSQRALRYPEFTSGAMDAVYGTPIWKGQRQDDLWDTPWNTQEIFAGTASGSRGDYLKIPEEMRRHYAGVLSAYEDAPSRIRAMATQPAEFPLEVLERLAPKPPSRLEYSPYNRNYKMWLNWLLPGSPYVGPRG